MKFDVIHAKKYSKKYLRHVSRLVYELINSAITRRYIEEKSPFIGPDGIQFSLVERGREDSEAVVYVSEDGFGLVTLSVPKDETCGPSESCRIPPWLEQSCDYSWISWVRPFFSPLYFGQVSLADASKLFKVPSDFLEEHFLSKQNDPESCASLLPLSVTRAALTPDETYIDIRGLIAWLVINQHVSQSD